MNRLVNCHNGVITYRVLQLSPLQANPFHFHHPASTNHCRDVAISLQDVDTVKEGNVDESALQESERFKRFRRKLTTGAPVWQQ